MVDRGADASPHDNYVGTLVGESTSAEFRIAVAHETIREQDIIAVDARLRRPEAGSTEDIRVWAKVQRIERINPLFPAEAGHELAATHTNPFDTVLSLSREMVSAVCRVLGTEPLVGHSGGKLDHLRYPPQPASNAYRPGSADLERVVLGSLQERQHRALDLATLSNRPTVSVHVDGHAIVSRHLAILAMTGAGKSWTARRIIEQLADKHYPMVIFDPRGDYSGLADVPSLRRRVRRYYAQFPVFEQSPDTVIRVIEGLGWELANTHKSLFEDLFQGAKAFLSCPADGDGENERKTWIREYLRSEQIERYGLSRDLYGFAHFVEALVRAGKAQDENALEQIVEWSGQSSLRLDKKTAGWLQGLPMNMRKVASELRRMSHVSKRVAIDGELLPNNKTELVEYDRISIISLAGYTGDLQATMYALIADAIFDARVSGTLRLPALLVLEEAHNFAPARADTPAEQAAISTTRQIAQEGRKFGVGLVVISQRPSRLDETTLSQCNSFIIMRMVNPADQNFVRRVVETLGDDEAKMLPDLDVGEALLSGQLINFPVLVRIKAPLAKGEHEEEDAFEELERARSAQRAESGAVGLDGRARRTP